MTQGDVIRKMNNEQLARLFARTYEGGMLEALQHQKVVVNYEENQKKWEEWINYEMM